VKHILHQRPYEQAQTPVQCLLEDVGEALTGDVGAIYDGREPHGRDDPPRRLGQRFEEVAEQGG